MLLRFSGQYALGYPSTQSDDIYRGPNRMSVKAINEMQIQADKKQLPVKTISTESMTLVFTGKDAESPDVKKVVELLQSRDTLSDQISPLKTNIMQLDFLEINLNTPTALISEDRDSKLQFFESKGLKAFIKNRVRLSWPIRALLGPVKLSSEEAVRRTALETELKDLEGQYSTAHQQAQSAVFSLAKKITPDNWMLPTDETAFEFKHGLRDVETGKSSEEAQ